MTSTDDLRPRGGEEQDLRLGLHLGMRRIEQQRPDAVADARAARLASHQHIVSLIAQPGGQKPDLRGLPAAFGTLEGDEAARTSSS